MRFPAREAADFMPRRQLKNRQCPLRRQRARPENLCFLEDALTAIRLPF